MTRRPKISHKSLQFSSKHDYNGEDSQSVYESNEEEEEDDDELEQHTSVSNSATNSSISENVSSNFSATPSFNPPSNQSTNSYINVAPLPTFHGDPNECPISHLSRFVKVCRANNVSSTDMMMRIFPVTLESEAAIWYDLNIEPYPSLSWDEIKISFLEAYRKIEVVDQLRSKLVMLSQGNEESVRSYFLRMQWILKWWPDHGVTDNVLKGIFVDGLMEDFRDWIIPQKPTSLNEALRLAFSFEQVKSIKGVKLKIAKCGFCDGSHEENCCQVKQRMRELVRNMSKNKQRMMVSSEEEKDIAENKNGEEEEEEGEEEKVTFSSKEEKSQCQCSKHQCWKKKLERNSSPLSRKSPAE